MLSGETGWTEMEAFLDAIEADPKLAEHDQNLLVAITSNMDTNNYTTTSEDLEIIGLIKRYIMANHGASPRGT